MATVHGYNLGNHNYGDNYGYQQHSVHKRSPRIPGLGLLGGTAALGGTLGGFGLGGLSAVLGAGSITGLSSFGLGGKTSLLFGKRKREAEPGYGYNSYDKGYNPVDAHWSYPGYVNYHLLRSFEDSRSE